MLIKLPHIFIKSGFTDTVDLEKKVENINWLLVPKELGDFKPMENLHILALS